MLKRFNKKKIKNYVRNTLLKEDDYKDLNLICVVKHGLIIKRYLYILQDYEDNFVVVIIEKNGETHKWLDYFNELYKTLNN